MAAAEISQLWCESHGLIDIGNGNLCFHVWGAVSFAKDQAPLWRDPGFRPVKMKPDQKEVFLLLLGLPINPLYQRLARTSPFLFPLKRVRHQGWSSLSLPQSFLQTHRRDSPLSSSCLLQVLFFPPALSSPSARLLAWLEWVEKKKRFQKPLAREPRIYFWRASFFFFSFKTKKATGKNRQYWGVGVCFSFGQVCLLSCPANVTTTALWGKSVA